MTNDNAKPNPGSPEAVANGCTCPVIDNGYGKGYLGDGELFGWVIAESCPIHWQAQKGEKDD